MPLFLGTTGGGWGFPSPLTSTLISTHNYLTLNSQSSGLYNYFTSTQGTTGSTQYISLQQMQQMQQMLYSNSATNQLLSNSAALQMMYTNLANVPINSPHIIPSTRREQIRRGYQAAQQWGEAQRETARIKDAAKERARELLLSFLTEEQRAEFAVNKNFIVEAASGTRYRITYGRIANIQVLELGHVKHRLCVHPANEDIPVEDVMLSQLLHLRADEAELVLRANIHR
jgi:hypothetical protein